MAKHKKLDSAMKELEKNYKTVLKEAVEHASKEAKKEVHQKALTCLQEYYNNYLEDTHEPKRYKRTESLRFAFVPYMNIKSNNQQIISTVGIEYNPDILEAYAADSYYDASKKYDNVDGQWVIENYLDGIHPTTDGSSIAGQAIYMEVVDKISPTAKMREYLTDYKSDFINNMHTYLASYVVSKM